MTKLRKKASLQEHLSQRYWEASTIERPVAQAKDGKPYEEESIKD
ncbi:MAG: hypothetical protein ACFB0D_16745 [Phormidesmis sp.]